MKKIWGLKNDKGKNQCYPHIICEGRYNYRVLKLLLYYLSSSVKFQVIWYQQFKIVRWHMFEWHHDLSY